MWLGVVVVALLIVLAAGDGHGGNAPGPADGTTRALAQGPPLSPPLSPPSGAHGGPTTALAGFLMGPTGALATAGFFAILTAGAVAGFMRVIGEGRGERPERGDSARPTFRQRR